MQTLEEFLEPRELPVRVIRPDAKQGFVDIYFKTARNEYVGLSKKGFQVNTDAKFEAAWSIYIPKKKVKKWLWAYESYLGKWRPTEVFYSEVEIIDMQVKSKHHKLENTMIAVEE